MQSLSVSRRKVLKDEVHVLVVLEPLVQFDDVRMVLAVPKSHTTVRRISTSVLKRIMFLIFARGITFTARAWPEIL